MADMLQLTEIITDHPILAYIAAWSIVTFGLFGYDKFKAQSGRWRTPESTLLGFCLFGGSIGGGLGMLLFRHKVSKRSFLLQYWGVVALQVVALGTWWYMAAKDPGASPTQTVITIESTPSTYNHTAYSANR